MGFFKKIFKGIKKILKAPIKMIKNAFKGDPLSIVALAASVYGGYSFLVKQGLTAAGGMAAQSSTGSDLFNIGLEAGGLTGASASAATTAGTGLMSNVAAGQGLGQVVKAASGITTKNMLEGVTRKAGKGLFGTLSDFWHGLDNKEKLMVGATGLKTIMSGIKNYQDAKFQNEYLKLKREEFQGIGSWTETFPKYKELHTKAIEWYKTDPALQKRVDSILAKMEDPEYARGFYTLAGLLANPSAQKILATDPFASIYS